MASKLSGGVVYSDEKTALISINCQCITCISCSHFQYMRILRHPGIVKLLDVEHDGGATYILTEKVMPLSLVLERMTCDEICEGLHSLIITLDFLHQRVSTKEAGDNGN